MVYQTSHYLLLERMNHIYKHKRGTEMWIILAGD